MRAPRPLWLAGAALALVLGLGAAGYRADLPYPQVRDAYETPDSRWLRLAGSQVHYTDQGNGPALLFLHGSGADLGALADAARATAALGYRVISVDLPGSGLSQAGPDTGFANADNVNFVVTFLQAIDTRPAAVLGHSTGGQIAWTLALDAPDLAQRLVLLAPTGQPTPSPLAWRLAALPGLGPMLMNVTPEFVVRQNLREAVFDDSAITAETVARYHRMLLRSGAREALFQRMRAVTFERVDELPCVTQPTLLLWGQEDVWLPPKLGAAFAEAMPDATLITLPRTGHNLPEEIPSGDFARLVDDWLGKAQPSSANPKPVPCTRAITH